MVMPDSQRYPWNLYLINNVKNILAFVKKKSFFLNYNYWYQINTWADKAFTCTIPLWIGHRHLCIRLFNNMTWNATARGTTSAPPSVRGEGPRLVAKEWRTGAGPEGGVAESARRGLSELGVGMMGPDLPVFNPSVSNLEKLSDLEPEYIYSYSFISFIILAF